MPNAVLQFNLGKLEWHPKSLQDVVEKVGHTFERPVDLVELEVNGADALHRSRRIHTDEELESFLQGPGESSEGNPKGEEHYLKVAVPPRILPSGYMPGEAAILATGKKIASFDGDGRADARVIDFQLRIFECGHFYMKQVMGSSHAQANPYWVIHEGRWRRSTRGYRLEFFFHYPRTKARSLDFTIHGQPGWTASSLNFSGDEEIDLKGFLPTIMPGHEASCWAALKRKADKPLAGLGRGKGVGVDGEEEDGEEEEEEEEEDALSAGAKQELVQSLMSELKPEQQQELRHALGKHGMSPELYSDLSPPLRQALGRLQRRAQVAARRRQFASDGEPTWPMYLGLVLFVLVFVIFAYLWYEEQYGSGKPVDNDEDDYWKSDEFY